MLKKKIISLFLFTLFICTTQPTQLKKIEGEDNFLSHSASLGIGLAIVTSGISGLYLFIDWVYQLTLEDLVYDYQTLQREIYHYHDQYCGPNDPYDCEKHINRIPMADLIGTIEDMLEIKPYSDSNAESFCESLAYHMQISTEKNNTSLQEYVTELTSSILILSQRSVSISKQLSDMLADLQKKEHDVFLQEQEALLLDTEENEEEEDYPDDNDDEEEKKNKNY